jgi:hypothetical protein
LGYTWLNLHDSEKVTFPFAQAKIDIMPWKTGLGLRLGYMIELCIADWEGAYQRYFMKSQTFDLVGFPANGKAMAGIVLWL